MSRSGMLQCNVIKTFDELVDAHHNSEEEINNAIKSYSTVGNRLARVHDTTFSDPDMRTYNRELFANNDLGINPYQCKYDLSCLFYLVHPCYPRKCMWKSRNGSRTTSV